MKMEPLCALLPLYPSNDMEAVQEENLGWQGNGRGWRPGVEAGAAACSESLTFIPAQQLRPAFSHPRGSAQQDG